MLISAGPHDADLHRCRSRLAELGYPTFPQLHLGSQDLHGLTSEEAFKDLLQRLETWFSENSLDVDAAAVVAKPAVASAAIGVKLASGAEGTENAIASLAEEVQTFLPSSTSHS